MHFLQSLVLPHYHPVPGYRTLGLLHFAIACHPPYFLFCHFKMRRRLERRRPFFGVSGSRSPSLSRSSTSSSSCSSRSASPTLRFWRIAIHGLHIPRRLLRDSTTLHNMITLLGMPGQSDRHDLETFIQPDQLRLLLTLYRHTPATLREMTLVDLLQLHGIIDFLDVPRWHRHVQQTLVHRMLQNPEGTLPVLLRHASWDMYPMLRQLPELTVRQWSRNQLLPVQVYREAFPCHFRFPRVVLQREATDMAGLLTTHQAHPQPGASAHSSRRGL
ncbi:uncharacterized protein MONBRDRAFT_8338 [Monosiga brevicollis MX1]|uniref:Uncharacterized protein n=1 Tax=Monosiga brevicollis TaxID=81824 RepID=A9UZS2_MONBE|nr:uncharacterized protein MONBRDRAFT_8338 [Monosiga brevicollis MX1]EDQ89417.1 predicted protein [Monosiga brevicollis MX1]|eukprot:XP_001745993.1 hypothetical protein [Monosiga brevicollis MX1]